MKRDTKVLVAESGSAGVVGSVKDDAVTVGAPVVGVAVLVVVGSRFPFKK